MEDWHQVADVLRPLARRQRGIQKQLALRWNVSEGLISRYINGETTPDPLLAARLCAALGVDLNELAGVSSRYDVEALGGTAADLERMAATLRARLAALESNRKP